MEDELKVLVRKNWGESFIISHNDFFNYENKKLFLTSDQLYIYSALCSLVRFNGSIITSISVIEECLPVPYSDNPNYNRRKIKEVLVELKERSIIETSREDINNLRVNESIIIYVDDEYIHENRVADGFEKISFDIFYKSESPMDFYLKCCVMRYDKNPLNTKKKDVFTNGLSCSYEEWSNILGRAERNTIKIMKDAVDRKVLHVNIGDYITENNQSVNTYRVRPFEEKEKTMSTKIREQEKLRREQDERHAFGKKKER